MAVDNPQTLTRNVNHYFKAVIMKPLSMLRSRRGTTLLELMLGLFISSIVIIGLYRVAKSVLLTANRERQKAEMQQSITSVSNIIERDIRMAGCGLPGNGLRAVLNDSLNDYLMIFSNEMRIQTTLTSDINGASYEMFVVDASGFSEDEWVCIEGPDTIYREIYHVTDNASGADRISIAGVVGVPHVFPAGSRVYAANRILYAVVQSPTPVLKRQKNDMSIDLGAKLQKIAVIPKKATGSIVAYAGDADVLTVVLGGYVGRGGNKVFYADSTEVNIRN